MGCTPSTTLAATPSRLFTLMRLFFSFFCLTLALASAVAAAAPSREESVFLFENRKLTVTLPEGFGWATAKDEDGMVNIRLADPKDRVSVELRFLPGLGGL